MELGLSGKRVLVTGASMGIGRAIAAGFAEEGCVVHVAARSGDALSDLAREIGGRNGSTIHRHTIDLGARDSHERLLSAVGEIDILVNNAGAIPFGPLTAIGDQQWRDSWDLKVFGYINLSRLYYAQMAARGSGVIILIAGLAGEKPNADYIAGTSGNAALMAFGRALGSRSLDHGVRVLTINPGSILTDRIMTFYRRKAKESYGDEARWADAMRDMKLPGGRSGLPEEIANVAVFMASERASYVSGTVVTVDGGLGSAG